MQVDTIDRGLLDRNGLGDGFLFFTQLIMDQQFYIDQAIRFIDAAGRDHVAQNPADILGQVDSLITIKIEQLESPRVGILGLLDKIHHDHMPETFDTHETSCHLFYAPAGAPSFPTHIDPVDLVILCIHGEKTMEIASEHVRIPKGSFVYIPANTPHRATNETESIMLSIGAEY